MGSNRDQKVEVLAAKPEFNPQDPCSGRNGLPTESSPPTSACAPWHIHAHTPTHTVNKHIYKLLIIILRRCLRSNV